MKKSTTQVTIESIANQENENPLVKACISFIKNIDDNGFSHQKIEDIECALREAVNNIITFAYPNKQGNISICLSMANDKTLKIKVRDFGCGIEDIAKAKEPLFTTKSGVSGMGFTIMDSFSDKCTIKSRPGKGTIVTMEFKM